MEKSLETRVKENLAEGFLIDNYRELCLMLEEDVKGGNQKKAQLTEWERFFKYEKRGNKFLITKVYEDTLPITAGRSKGNNAIYIKYIETLLLHMLSQQEDKTIVCTKNHLLVALGMVNRKYIDKSSRKVLVSSKVFTSKEINEFDNRAYQIIDRILFSALKSLEKRFLLNWKQELHYEKIDTYTGKKIQGVATDEEMINYTAAKYEVLKDLGIEEGKPDKYDKLMDIYFYGKSEKFYELLTDKLYDSYSWDKTCIMFRLLYKKENIIDAIPRTEKQLLQMEQKFELNEKIVIALNKNAETKYNNMLSKFQKEYDEICIMNECEFGIIPFDAIKSYKPPNNYIDRQQLIAEEFIRINNNKIKKTI